MIIGSLSVHLSIPEARSLKDKRAVLRSMKDRARNRMNISVAEVGRQNEWKFAELAFVTVASESKAVQQRLSKLMTFVRSEPRCVVTHMETEMG
ncbi:DUF503 domain-containing protein [Kiritimatiella glycovorans]|uniref:DUF503 domain-containing protein n=1 Tax=Kiritimatiella glycovorans TaxID=1307763 RepID=A0A0G3EGQ4_9BACT|nr:DUF503 domain-containing protein [Kiritimatiella glycovorans]AKJ63990.1 hypothetical protein L21SP4_00722 [Kiritimatiella glycovorans]